MSGSGKRPDWPGKTDEEWMRIWKQDEGVHWFSEKYESEKQENLVWVSRKGGEAMRKKGYKKWIAAAAALILVPGTVFAAGKLYEVYVEKQGYQADLHIVSGTNAGEGEGEPSSGNETENSLPDGVRYYHLNLNYVPEGMEYLERHGMYMYPDRLVGISTLGAFDLGEGESVIQVPNIEETENFEAAGRPVSFMRSASHSTDYAFVIFEEEHLVVWVCLDKSVPEDEMRKVLENLELQPVPEEECPERPSRLDLAVHMTWEQYMSQEEDPLFGSPRAVHAENDDGFETMEVARVLEIGEPVSVYGAAEEDLVTNAEVRVTVEKVEVLDDISQLSRENFEYPTNEQWWGEMFAEDGSILPYIRQDLEFGDGVSAPYETVVNEEEARSKVVLVTIKRENLSGRDLQSGVSLSGVRCFTSNLVEENGSFVLKQNRMWLGQSRGWANGSAIYAERDNSKDIYSEDKGRQFFFWRMDAGDVQEYTLGFLIDEDRLNDLYYTEKVALMPGDSLDGTTIAFRLN